MTREIKCGWKGKNIGEMQQGDKNSRKNMNMAEKQKDRKEQRI